MFSYEKQGMLSNAFENAIRYAEKREGLISGKLNIERLSIKIERKAREIMSAPVSTYHENAIYNPNNIGKNLVFAPSGLPRPIVSFTTIHSRLDRVPYTVETLLTQSLSPLSINLYISDSPYLIDEGIQRSNQILDTLITLGVNIYFVPNIGPYRKQYPVIKQLLEADATKECPIVTVDDDVLYPSDTLATLVDAMTINDCVVSHRGRHINCDKTEILNYRSFGIPTNKPSMNSLGTGRNGIAYKLGYFPDNFKYYNGPLIAPTADDLWCKWFIGIRCIPTMILEPRAAFDLSLDFKETDTSDRQSLYHKFNSSGSNDICLAMLETYLKTRMNTTLHSLMRKPS